jgi:hypothetical protein
MNAAGPSQGANWPCRPLRCETQRLPAAELATQLANEAASVGAQ